MTSSKRDFTNFDKFPGSIDEGTKYHTFPTLWYQDDANRWRIWNIYCRLIKINDGSTLSGIDWDLLHEKQVPIKSEYYQMGSILPEGIQAEAWVETGIEGGKITRSSPTYFTQSVNVGKANERNAFQQCLIYARSTWLKRKDKGATEKKSADNTSLASKNVNVMYFPMLARTYKDSEKYLAFPLYVQPKLDGIRCLTFLRKYNGGSSEVVIYTRTKKLFPSVDYLKKILYPYLNSLYDTKNNQSIYLDGELYKHGKKLQDISGDSRNESADVSKANTNRNEYHIYDCFYPKELSTTYENRYKQLLELYKSLDDEDATVIKSVPTYLVKTLKEAEAKYAQFTKVGYEGAMLRNIKGEYLASAEKTGSFLRSHDLVKMKPKFTDEFVVVDYTEGSKGKDKGAIIWVCETDKGVRFNVTPKDITYEERYKLYSDAVSSFKKKYSNRYLTVEYEDLSKTGVPLRAKAITFRDYE